MKNESGNANHIGGGDAGSATVPPHPTLTRYYPRDEDRQRYVNSLFERAAPHYERACRILFPGFKPGQAFRRQALERGGLKPGMRVLDVATGTGLLARSALSIVSDKGLVVGLDPSPGMLRESHRVLAMPLIQAVGDRLPVRDEQFDLVCMGYALRHVSDLEQTFREYGRVLKPGGLLVLLDVTRPRTALGVRIARLYFQQVVPLVTRIATGSRDAELLMRYFWDTIAESVPANRSVEALGKSGFTDVRHRTAAAIFSEFNAVKAT